MLKADQKILAEALDKVSSAVEGSTPLNEIFSCILLELQGSILSLTGSDGVVRITSHCEVTPEGADGEALPIAVNARKFKGILNSMGGGSVELRTEDKTLHITGDRGSHFRLALRIGSEYPQMNPDGDPALEADLSVGALASILDSVHSAISNQNHRVYLAGAYFDFLEDGLHIVATDGHRLATAKLDAGGAADASFILPRKGVLEIKRLLSSADADSVRLTAHKEGDAFRSAHFHLAGLDFSCQLIQGQYPNYERVIPSEEDNSIHCLFKHDDLLSGVRRVCAVHDKSGEGVKLSYGGEGDTLQLMAQGSSSPGDEAQVQIPLATDQGAFDCQFNSGYLLDLLGAFEGKGDLRMAFKDEQASMLCTADKDDAAQLRYVVMPMR